jgi:hypothetical protein
MINIEDYIKSELKNFNLELTTKPDGREGVDFLIGDNQLYLQPLNLDTTQRSVKISKEALGKLRDDLFVVLVLVIDNEPRSFYLIPSTELTQSENDVFIDNNVKLMPHLSNWEIKVSSNTIPKLAKYSLANMINKLKA